MFDLHQDNRTLDAWIRIGLVFAVVLSVVISMERLADAQTEEPDQVVTVCIAKGGSIQVVSRDEPCPRSAERTILATSAALEAVLKQLEVVDQRVDQIIAAELGNGQVLASCLKVKAVAAQTITDLQAVAAEWPSELNEQQVSWVVATLNEEGSVETTERQATISAEKLGEIIAELEAEAECQRNGTNSLDTYFSNDDQKNAQLYELLSVVMKTMHEMRSLGGSNSGGP
jgi:hypothetical protein